MTTLREKIEDVVRDLLRTQPAAAQSVLTESIHGSSSFERQADFDRMDELRAQQGRDLPPMRSNVEALTTQIATLDKQRAALQQELVTAAQQLSHRNHQLSNELEKLDAKVRKTASPAIDVFMAEMDKEADSLRVHGHSRVTEIGPPNLFTESLRKPKSVYSDGPSIKRRVQAVINARRAAEGLKAERLTEEQLTRELNQLQEGLPPIVEEEINSWLDHIAEYSNFSHSR